MDNKDFYKKSVLPLISSIGICLIAYFIYKLVYPNTPPEENISINSNKLRNIDLLDVTKKIKLKTPYVDDKTAKLLYLSFQVIFREYGRWQDLVIIHPPKESSIKLEGKKIDESEIFWDAFFTMPFVKINDECFYKVSDFEMFLVKENEAVIYNIAILSDINYDKELRDLLLEKSIKIEKDDIKIAPIEIMFAKYVKFFILKTK